MFIKWIKYKLKINYKRVKFDFLKNRHVSFFFSVSGIHAVHDATVAYPYGICEGEQEFVQGIVPKEVHFHLKEYSISEVYITFVGIYVTVTISAAFAVSNWSVAAGYWDVFTRNMQRRQLCETPANVYVAVSTSYYVPTLLIMCKYALLG